MSFLNYRPKQWTLILGFLLTSIVLFGCEENLEFQDIFSIEQEWFFDKVSQQLDIARDEKGNFYFLVNNYPAKFIKFSPDGTKLWERDIDTEEGNIFSFTIDEEGRILYANAAPMAKCKDGHLLALSADDGHTISKSEGLYIARCTRKVNHLLYIAGIKTKKAERLHAISPRGEYLWGAWLSNPKAEWGTNFFMDVNKEKKYIYTAEPLCEQIQVYSFEGKYLFGFGTGKCVKAKTENVAPNSLKWTSPPEISGLYTVGEYIVTTQTWGISPMRLSLWTYNGKKLVRDLEMPWTPLFASGNNLYFDKGEKENKEGLTVISTQVKSFKKN